jgi:MFS family permease
MSKALSGESELKFLKTRLENLNLIFAISIMAWVPRFPEVKANLHLTNGEFGTVMSTGTLGALLGLLTMGHVAHSVGNYKVFVGTSLIYIPGSSLLVILHNVFIFTVIGILNAALVSGFVIALNSQTLHEQERFNTPVIPRAHGKWSLGALVSITISGLLVGRVSIAIHIFLLSAACLTFMLLELKKLKPYCLKANEIPDEATSIRKMFVGMRIDWAVSIGMVLGMMLEFSAGDWTTIFAKEDLKMSAGVATIPYLIFMLMMIIGRLNIHKFTMKTPIEILLRRMALFGGIGFLFFLNLGSHLSGTNAWLGFYLVCLAFIFAGLGGSVMSPMYMGAASYRSDKPSSMVVGQTLLVTNSVVFFVKAAMSWVAQFASITAALSIPGIMLVATIFFTHTTRGSIRGDSA